MPKVNKRDSTVPMSPKLGLIKTASRAAPAPPAVSRAGSHKVGVMQDKSFKARPLPITTVRPEVVVKPRSALGAVESNAGRSSEGGLKSTVRARQRAAYEMRRARGDTARRTKEEMVRAENLMVEMGALEEMREMIRDPMPR